MSVLVPDHKVFEYLYAGIYTAAVRNTVDAKHSYVLHRYFDELNGDIHKEAERLVKSWLRMCEQSYNAAYKETGTTDYLLKPGRMYDFTPVQLLKYAQCVHYNIERPGILTPQQHNDFKLLEKWIPDLMNAIINDMPEYKAAKWSEI